MSINIDETQQQMDQVLEHLEGELKKVRTGRASTAILDSVVIEAYGQQMPLKHAANVVVVDAQLIQITPFDPNNLGAISTAISEANLGLNPSDDGNVVRVPVPALTEERRKELVKSLGEKVEEARIALRNIRQDILKSAKTQKAEGTISEDDFIRVEKQVDELMEKQSAAVEALYTAKEKEILTV
jgi:ribosome recycling factor